MAMAFFNISFSIFKSFISFFNSYNLPNQETIDKLNAVGTKIYRTDESGNILVTSDGSNIQVETNVK